jgi:hypothetical protein
MTMARLLQRQRGAAALLFTAAVFFSTTAVADKPDQKLETKIAQAKELCTQGHQAAGAQHYLHILHDSTHPLPPARRLALIEALAWCDHQVAAIGELEQFIQEQSTAIAARLLLAKLLSWNGRLLEAERVAEEILTLTPGQREARLVQANAANWRGDFYSALPIYRELLLEEEEFDTRLSYTYALLATGNYREAKVSRWWLYAFNKSQNHAVFEVNQALLDQSRQNISWQSEYLAEQGGSRRLEQSLSFNFPFNLSGMSVNLRHQQASAPWNIAVEEVDELLLAGHWRQSSAWKVAGHLGWITGGTAQEIGNLNIELGSLLQMKRWLWDLTLSQELFDDSAAILAHNIQRQDLYNQLQYTVNDWVRINGELRNTHYSDDNSSHEGIVHLRYALSLLKPRIEFGYKHYQSGFKRQSDGGYFAPDRNTAQQLTLGFNTSRKNLEASGEIFYGRQTVSMLDIEQKDKIAGATLSLSYNLNSNLGIKGSIEGGDFALGKPDGYYYYLATLGLSLFF